MNIIKGFALNRNFVDNAPGVVTEIGELSTTGFTFAKEPRVYSSQTYPTISLVHFPTIGSDVGTTGAIPDVQKDHILKVIKSIYDRSAMGGLIAPGAFVEYMITQMGGEVADITTGGSVTTANRSIIEWVQWRNTTVGVANVNKVWFINDSFVGQYDDGEIEVILPFEPADLFFGQPADVKALLAKWTYTEEMERIQAARGGTSETVLWGNTYNYVNPVNRNDKTPAKFTALLYGRAMDNIDVIKEAIVQHLLASSNYTRDQWKNILPDLFLRSEFIVVPSWNKIAIENVVGSTNGVFSPVVDLEIDQTFLWEVAALSDPLYTDFHVRSTGQSLPFPYMSITLSTVGHPENRDAKFKITDYFPDYFFTGITSADFSRMSQVTREWVLMMHQLVIYARTLTNVSTVPQGYSRVVRGGRMFLAKSHKAMQYLVLAPSAP